MTEQALGRVVAIATGKGGTLKTSLTANAAGIAAAEGYKTLLVDLDPQGDLQDDLGFFDAPNLDDGQHLATAMLTGAPLRAILPAVRPNLDVIPGGGYLGDVGGALLARQARGGASFDLLAKALAPLASDYDLVFIDTPPTDETLQMLALRASRWLVIPTKADTSSIRAMRTIASKVAGAREGGHQLDLLGVVLAGVPTAAKRVRQEAENDIRTMLGDVAPLFEGFIRDSAAVARQARRDGILVHELAEKVEGAEPFWRSLRAGTPITRLPGTAPDLASDYVRVVEQILLRINELELGATA
jgi:chromosome partitioning protein